MKKKILAIICLALAGVAVFTLASCMGKETTLEDVAYITANKKLVIGITDFEPMDYQDASGKWVGFDAELAEKVCEKLGVTAQFQLINWDNKIEELNGKTIDCIWNGFTVNAERQGQVSFSKEYMINKQVIVIRKGDSSKYTDVASLTDAALVAEAGSAGEDAVSANEVLKDNTYIGQSGQTDALKEVIAKTADAAVIDYTMAAYLINKEEGDFTTLTILDTEFAAEEYYAIGFRKGSDLTEKVDSILAELKADGTITAIAEKYGLAESLAN